MRVTSVVHVMHLVVPTEHRVPRILCQTREEYRAIREELEREGFRYARTASFGFLPDVHGFLKLGYDVVLLDCNDDDHDQFDILLRGGPAEWPSGDSAKYFEGKISGHLRRLDDSVPDSAGARYSWAYERSKVYRRALEITQEAEVECVRLSDEYSVARLQEELERCKRIKDDAWEHLRGERYWEDHALCVSNYNAWRIENK